MGAYKNLIKNIFLFLFVGAAPSLCWAAGFFTAFSWASFFLLLGGLFCILWIKARHSSQTLRSLLLSRDEAWAICEGNQIIERSPSFPGDSLEAFKNFLHPDALLKVEFAIETLIYENTPFQMKVRANEGEAIYSFRGEALNEKVVFWFKNITDAVYQEQLHTEIQQKNEKLLSNLQGTMDLLPILVWHRDEHQKINYCNLAYSNAVQALPQKVYEEGIELIQSRFAKTLARKAINTAETQTFESTAIAEGERKHFRICEIPHKKNQCTLGLAFDISELNELQTEIKRLVAAHDEVLAHLSTAITIYDGDGALQYYNQAYVKLHGLDEEFLNNKPRLDEVLEELRSHRQLPEYADFPAYKRRHLQELHEQMGPKEDLMHLPDERTIRIYSAPHPMGGLLFMFEDVTDYLALERTNKALLDAYQTTLDNLFEGVVVIGSDNRFKIFNPSFVRLWNFKDEEIQPEMHLAQVIEAIKDLFDYGENWETYKAQCIESLTDRIPKTGQIKRKDGIVVNFRYVPLPNGDHLLSYTDATDTFLVQTALQEKNEALEIADRMKSEFIANVSYELKSPLNKIIGFSEILSHQSLGELNPRQVDYINGVLESSNKLLHLVNDILDLASIEAGSLTLEPRTIDIPTLLKETIGLASQRAELKNQRLELKCHKALGEWIVDEKRLKQALFNLFSNAIKFTDTEGKITLEAKITEDALELSVTDTGIGIAPEDQMRLLEKFERGKSNMQIGAGLGLPLVKNLIELHGGSIHLFSEVNKGTKVTCYIPKVSLEKQTIQEKKV